MPPRWKSTVKKPALCWRVAANLFAVVTDELLETDVKQFGLEDVKGVADLVVEKFIKPGQERVSLYVNGERASLSEFPPQKVLDLIMSLANNLKGVQEIHNLEFSYQKDEKR